MKKKEIVTILTRIAEDLKELAKLMQDSPELEKEGPMKAIETLKEPAPVKEETAEATAGPTEKIEFDMIRSTLAKKAADGCRQQVKDLLKEYSLTCISYIEAHPELFAEILQKTKTW